MMVYLPAKVIPLIESLAGVRRVLVREEDISTDVGSCVPQSPQKLCVSGLSVWHFGHFTDTIFPNNKAMEILSISQRRVNYGFLLRAGESPHQTPLAYNSRQLYVLILLCISESGLFPFAKPMGGNGSLESAALTLRFLSGDSASWIRPNSALTWTKTGWKSAKNRDILP